MSLASFILDSKPKKKKELPSQHRQSGEARKKQLPSYRSFRLQRRIKVKDYQPLPSAWKLWRSALQMLWIHRKKIGLFLVVYAIVYIIFVRGLSGGIDLGELRDSLEEDTSTATGIITSVTLFSVLLSTSAATQSETASLYQVILMVLGSLAFIWLLRQLSVEKVSKNLRIRDAFYNGMQPLIPFLLVLLVIALEFIPLSLGGFIIGTVQANDLAGTGAETFAVLVVSGLLALLSLYLISGSLAALYIVTLPGMTPMKAIRSSHRLLRMHRWSVVRKLIVLVLLLLATAMLIFLPLLFFVPSSLAVINEYIFFACSIAAFAIFHIYVYNLYKSLL